MKNNLRLNDLFSFKEKNGSLRYGKLTAYPDTKTDNNWVITWQDNTKENVCDVIFNGWIRDGRINVVSEFPKDEDNFNFFTLDEPDYISDDDTDFLVGDLQDLQDIKFDFDDIDDYFDMFK